MAHCIASPTWKSRARKGLNITPSPFFRFSGIIGIPLYIDLLRRFWLFDDYSTSSYINHYTVIVVIVIITHSICREREILYNFIYDLYISTKINLYIYIYACMINYHYIVRITMLYPIIITINDSYHYNHSIVTVQKTNTHTHTFKSL